MRNLRPAVVIGSGYLAGGIPISNLMARLAAGVDLRNVGTGTVSGTGLYEVSGFGPLAVAGVIELTKGAVGPLLAGRQRRVLGAAGAAAAVIGHNWSPWINFRGGRGISVLLGATAVLAPSASLGLALGLTLGRLVRETGVGTFAGLIAMPLLFARRDGRRGLTIGLMLVGPVLCKRIVGNDGKFPRTRAALVQRLVADRDAANMSN